MNLTKSKKQKILIVDDSEINRSILADILEEEYEILEAEDGIQAIESIQQYGLDIAVILLDIVMPRMDGLEVLMIMKQKHWIEDIPVIVISAENDSKQIEKVYDLGVSDFIGRPFDALIVYRRVVNTILLYAKQKKLVSIVADQIGEKEQRSNMMVEILSHIVEFRNEESNHHIIHIRTFVEVMLRQLQRMTDAYHLTQSKIALISLAAALHDIGKIMIDEKILKKPGKLTKEEFEIIKTHTLIGAMMLEKLPKYRDTELVKTAYEICRWHHERYDGKGYPDGLKGEEIPISAQIVALADVYDALISERCYKNAFSHKTAIQMILNGECGKFSSLLMDCLQKVESRLDVEFAHLQVQEKNILRQGLLNEILRGENVFASERSLNLLDQERMKYSNYSKMTEEIQFEYILANNTLMISDLGVQKLNIDKVIQHPSQDEKLIKLLQKDVLAELAYLVKNASPKEPTIHYECQFCINHTIRWYQLTIQTQWFENIMIGAIGKAIDVHDVKTKMDFLEQKSQHDSATNLLNHASAKSLILHQMEENPSLEYTLIIFDIDNFKSVNDTYGHIFGDGILKNIAEKVQNIIDEEDISARIGGDEFLIFFQCRKNYKQKIEKILKALIGNYEGLMVTISMGVALTSAVGKDYPTLFYAADQALYSAKRDENHQYLIYDDSMKETLLKI